MQRTSTLRGGLLVAAALLAGLIAVFFATRSSNAGAATSRVVMTTNNKTLHKTILVNRRGMSLYSLSVERRGRFICTTGGCLAEWKPLTIAKGTKPTGVAGLGTVRRPDHRIQVTYRGGPLYTFDEDHKRGDVKGNGFKDVGTWHVVVVGKSSSAAPAPAPKSTYGY